MLKHFNIKILGSVQGVNFRYYSLQKAKELNIKGFVRNEPDGSVYIEAEGDENDLKNFLQWCQNGPGFAKVEKVDIQEGEIKNFSDFSIEY